MTQIFIYVQFCIKRQYINILKQSFNDFISELYNLFNSFNLQFYKLHGLKAILTTHVV